MSIKTRFAVFLGTLLLPAFALAAAPANVTGIHAQLQGGKVLVTWTPVTGQQIASYLVFYSHASILGNNGLYDDYDTVDGSVNSDLLQNIPPVQTLYVSVIAVNGQGEESPAFAEEASVDLTGGNSTSAAASSAGILIPSLPGGSSSAPSMQSTSSTVQRLIGAQSISATGVLLTFTLPVAVDPTMAQTAFSMKTASGDVLQMTRLTIQGNTIRIDTAPQWRNVVYSVTVGGGVTGKDSNGNVILMDASQAPMLFTGSQDGTAQPMQQPQGTTQPSPATGADVTNLRLNAQAQTDGTYIVQASWLAPASGSIAHYQVLQSTDGGNNYGPASTVDRNASGISIPNVPAGMLTVLVRVSYTDGTTSRGIMQSINLPSAGATSNNTQANLSQHTRSTSTKLPQSGPALWVTLAMTGALVGYGMMMKKRTVEMAQM